MIQVEAYETIRRAYFIEGWSIREINRRWHYCRRTIRKALAQPIPAPYTRRQPRAAPVLGPYQAQIDQLLAESAQLPRKQRYTAHKIFLELRKEGYPGSEGTVRRYVAQQRSAQRRVEVYLPLEFDPGEDAQVDWGEAEVVLAGERVTVQLFHMRLNHSHARFAMAFPFQKQEAFFAGHIAAFHFFGGVPHTLTYDNLKTAVFRVLAGRNRQEQQAFVAFRSYYLCASRYCTPAQGHEKGAVESDVGYVRRNFLVPLPAVASFAELNAYLEQACLQDAQRHVRGESRSVAEVWAAEKPHLLPLPAQDFPACVSVPVKANPYSQVVFETNRYSVPWQQAGQQLVLRAWPFRVEVLALAEVIACHPRCFGREQDILDPLHYLDLVRQRPGAFDHALPVRRWRATWPAVYETLLTELRRRFPDGRGVREFVAILQLHRDHPAPAVEAAIREALQWGAAHLDGVKLCLQQQAHPVFAPTPLDLSAYPRLQGVGDRPVNLAQYDRLLAGR